MISRKTIDQVYDLDIVEVAKRFVPDLKKKGPNYQGLSPFVNEKTPSFIVSPSKNLATCFSSDISSPGPVNLVMNVKDVEWIDAINWLCDSFNITKEYDNSPRAQEYAKRQQIVADLSAVNSKVHTYFVGLLDQVPKEQRRLPDEILEIFGVGYSGKDKNALASFALDNGIQSKDLIDASLLGRNDKDGSTYDYFLNRILFPIYNKRKQLLGFSGRYMGDFKKDRVPKYKNTRQTKIYDKSQNLFGIHLAAEHIRKTGEVYLVEGNFDVPAMYASGYMNTVGPCGTAFTEEQLEILKGLRCRKIILVLDGDPAGVRAAMKSIEMIIQEGINCELVELPEGSDPFDLFEEGEKVLQDFIEKNKEDAVEWKAEQIMEGRSSTIDINEGITDICNMLALIPSHSLRNSYIREISKRHKIQKKDVESMVRTEVLERAREEKESGFVRLPEGVDREEFEEFGFYEITEKGNPKTGYWFINQAGKFERQTNFTIRPIFHIKSKTDNKRLIEITNSVNSHLVDIPSKGFVGKAQFEEAVIDQGNYTMLGSSQQFKRIISKVMSKFDICTEIKTLGWQKHGFWAFADGIVDGQFKKIDEQGIVQFGDRKYFLPACSKMYRDVMEEEDLYESDRFFVYKKAEVDFKTWALQMQRVHLENGNISVAYFVTSVFRDYIFMKHKVFPHLFLFGDVETGKSFAARSLNAIFHGNEPGFNLNSGTNVAFFRKLARFKNSIAWFDEYQNDIDLKRFQALKAAFDGLGHDKGVMSRDNRTETTKVNSAAIISGQFLPARDGNSLFTRSILLNFSRKANELSIEDRDEGDKLKSWEENGLSSLIVEVIKYRELIEKRFGTVFMELLTRFKTDLKNQEYSGRILQNFILILTPVAILEDKLRFPFTLDEIYAQCKEMIIDQSNKVSNSDALMGFWKIVEFLFATYAIESGVDFKIKKSTVVHIAHNRHEREHVKFDQEKTLLFIRFRKIHPLYLESHRKQHNTPGIEDGSLKHYFKQSKAFIGLTPGERFEDSPSSAYVFDYDELDIILERNEKVDPADHPHNRQAAPQVEDGNLFEPVNDN